MQQSNVYFGQQVFRLQNTCWSSLGSVQRYYAHTVTPKVFGATCSNKNNWWTHDGNQCDGTAVWKNAAGEHYLSVILFSSLTLAPHTAKVMTAETECPKVILYLKSGLFSHQTTVSTDYYYVEMFDSYSNQTCGKLIMINALSTAPDNLLQTGAFLLIHL